MLWFRIDFDSQSIEEIDRHLLLAPLLPRLCPGLLLVDTTLSAGLLALLSCYGIEECKMLCNIVK